MAETASVKDGRKVVFTRAESERDPARVLVGLRRRWWVIALIGVIAAAGAYGIAGGKTKQYQASASLLFTNSHLDQQLVGSNQIVATSDPARQAATNEALVNLPTIPRLVSQQLHIPVGIVRSEVAVGSDATSDVLTVSVTDPSPARAAEIANAYVQQYIAFRKSQDQAQLGQAKKLVASALANIAPSKQNSAEAQKLQQENLNLQLEASLQTGNAQAVQAASVSHSPVSPTPTRDAILGLVLGLLTGTALLVGLERRDRRLKLAAEVEELYDVPVLGTIPESNQLAVPGAAGSVHDREAFSMMRAQLRYFDVDRDVKRVMITSADLGEGKSVIALNLARVAAQAQDRRALLIETDLRRPSLGPMMGLDAVVGLSELLGHTQDLASGLRELVVTPEPPEGFSGTHFDVLLAGATPPNPAELLQSHRMSELLELADGYYDLIVLDTAPIGMISDAIPLVHQVDGVLVVTRLGYSRRDRAMRLMQQLRGLSANVLGVVINGSQEARRGYYGYYGYDYERGGSRRSSSRTSSGGR